MNYEKKQKAEMKIWNSKTGMMLMAMAVMACNQDIKREQTVYFEEIAPQLLRDGSVQLKAAASSGLPVTFVSADENIATVEDDRAVFHAAGSTLIYAIQRGNGDFYEAPDVSQNLLVRDWDRTKKTQTITFELPAVWQISYEGQIITLEAVASSGLPVAYTLQGEPIGRLLGANILYVYHGGEGNTYYNGYNIVISIIASQEGNGEYNPADNVTRQIRIFGDELHDE